MAIPVAATFILLDTEFDVIVKSVETDLGRWTLVVAVISVDAYLFLAFSDLTYHLEDARTGVSWLHCAPDSKETELGRSKQEAFVSAGKNLGIVLVPCRVWKCVPTAISDGVYLPVMWTRGPWVSFVTTDEFAERFTKITHMPHSLPFYFWHIFNSMNYGHIIKMI